jgi:SAM-dependent methyltransferase
MHRRPPGPGAVWSASLGLAAAVIRREPKLGLKRLVLPVSYWRTAEFAYAWERLSLPRGARVLDVGSPKELGILLARHEQYHVTSTDILQKEVDISRRYASALGISGTGPGEVQAQVEDGRALSFPSESFDAVVAVAVIEHIPDRGDVAAVEEMLRVTKPGGCVVLTVPFDRHARETWVDRSVYEREQSGDGKVFYQRHYDEATLGERMVDPGGAQLEDLQIWGEERIPAERLLGGLGKLDVLIGPAHALISAACLRRLDVQGPGRPMAAFLTLRKPRQESG